MRLGFAVYGGAGDGVEHDEHVAGLFDGHLIFIGPFAAAVGLAVGERVGAEVVRGEGEAPAIGERGVLHQGAELGLKQGGIEEEEEWSGGVEDVDGTDRAIRGVLLAEDEGLAV